MFQVLSTIMNNIMIINPYKTTLIQKSGSKQ